MICPSCGAEIRDGSKFCPFCGKAVEGSAGQQNETNSGNPGAQASAISDRKPSLTGKKIGIIGAVVALVILVIVLIATHRTTINLNKYVNVTFDGYNTVGTADIDFDSDKFIDDYKGKIKFDAKRLAKFAMKMHNDSDDEELAEITTEFAAYVTEYGKDEVAPELIAEAVDGACNLDHRGSLKNDDSLTVKWDLDDDDVKFIEEGFKIKLKYKDFSVKVSGLKDAKTVDLFKDIDVSFGGAEPDGIVNVTLGSDSMWNDIKYSCDKTGGLSNGDQVVITLEGYDDDLSKTLATKYGVIPKVTSKTYTVEGLSKYISSVDEIPEDTMKQMEDAGAEYFKNNAIEDWTKYTTFDGADYIGNCFIMNNMTSDENDNDSDDYEPFNGIYLVYKIGVTIKIDDYFDQILYYDYVKYNDLFVDNDGNCGVDLSNFSVADATFLYDSGVNNGWFETFTWNFHGYRILDHLLLEVDGNSDSYTITKNVSDGDTAVNKTQADALDARTVKINGKAIDDGVGDGKEYNGHYYVVYKNDDFATYDDAEKYCEGMGGHMISINDEKENQFVTNNLLSDGNYYIGLTDEKNEGKFKWSDGTKLKYTNWADGQPDNSNGDENYGEIYSDGTWNDWYWDTGNYIICEFDSLPDKKD